MGYPHGQGGGSVLVLSAVTRYTIMLMWVLVPFFPLLPSFVHAHPALNYHAEDYPLVIQKKLERLHALANRTILVHEHIPKVGGTALSYVLSSECTCEIKVRVQTSCTQCPLVYGWNGFSYQYSVSRATGWTFGMHAPFANLFDGLNQAQLAQNGLIPLYIVMLREPFARFVSEARTWVGRYQVAFDWSIYYKAKV